MFVASIALLGLANALPQGSTFERHSPDKNVVQSLMGKIASHSLTAHPAVTNVRELSENKNFWFVQDVFFTDSTCSDEQPSFTDSHRISGCTQSGVNSMYTSCSEDATNVYAVYTAFASTDCSGTVAASAQVAQYPAGCQVTPDQFGERIHCVNADFAVDTKKADYGHVQYFDEMCSDDNSNVQSAQGWNVVGDCLILPDFAVIGAPDYIMSAKFNECGESTDFFTDSACKNLNFTETETYNYYCHNNNNTDDHYFDDNSADDDHFDADGMGSYQSFCEDGKNGHGGKRSKAKRPERKEKKRFEKHGHDGNETGFQRLRPLDSVEMDTLLFDYMEQTASAWSGFEVVLAGGLLAVAGVFAAKFYKSKTGFETVPVESMHSSI